MQTVTFLQLEARKGPLVYPYLDCCEEKVTDDKKSIWHNARCQKKQNGKCHSNSQTRIGLKYGIGIFT